MDSRRHYSSREYDDDNDYITDIEQYPSRFSTLFAMVRRPEDQVPETTSELGSDAFVFINRDGHDDDEGAATASSLGRNTPDLEVASQLSDDSSTDDDLGEHSDSDESLCGTQQTIKEKTNKPGDEDLADMLNSRLSEIAKPEDAGQEKKGKAPVEVESFGAFATTTLVGTLAFLATFAAVFSVAILAFGPQNPTPPEVYQEFLKANLPSLESIRSSATPAMTQQQGLAMVPDFIFSSMAKPSPALSSSSSRLAGESSKPSNAVLKQITSLDHDASKPIVGSDDATVPPISKEPFEKSASTKFYIYLKSGEIVPYASFGFRTSSSSDRLGPYQELVGSQRKFIVAFDYETNQFKITSTKPYRGSLAILVLLENGKMLMRGHQHDKSSTIEWVPSNIPTSELSGKEFSVAVVIPAENTFQMSSVSVYVPVSTWTDVAVRLSGALSHYVEPFHSKLHERIRSTVENVEQLMPSAETCHESLEKSVIRAQGSAIQIANEITARMNQIMESTKIQSRVSEAMLKMHDQALKIHDQALKGIASRSTEALRAVDRAQKRAHEVKRLLTKKSSQRSAQKEARKEARKEKGRQRKRSQFSKKWMKGVV
jgi:hypothetical protein